MKRARRYTRLLPSRSRPRYTHKVQLLASPFRYADRRILFGRARLYADRIELASWGLLGRRTRAIPLDTILDLDYHPLQAGSNISLQLEDGELVQLHLDRAHVWRAYFENWLRYDVLPSAKLMNDAGEALDTAG